MSPARNLRWTGLLLLAGVVVYAVASIGSEPFERDTAQQLYQGILDNVEQWRFINGLAAAGLVVLFVGFLMLRRALSTRIGRTFNWGLALLGLAIVLWLAEIALRMTTTVSVATGVANGEAVPTSFPQTVGIGLEILFLAFLAAALGGIALLVLSLSQSGLIPSWIAYAGAALTVVSGAVAAVTYPWVGGVERALFYPLILVVLPLSIWLLVRGNRALATLH